MQPYEPSFEESANGHFPPPVIVGIADHESRKDEEKVNGEIAVRQGSVREKLEHMVDDNDQCGHSTKAVQDVIMGFGVLESHYPQI